MEASLRWARISVIAAGPIFNFILAYVLSVFIIGSIGYDQPVILQVSAGYPAAEAGIQPGDVITKINGKKIHLYREVSNYSLFHQKEYASGKTVTVEYVRDGEKKTAQLVPVDNGYGKYVMGISGNTNYRTEATPIQVLKYSAYEVKYWIDSTFDSLKMLFQGGVTLNDVSGPVGVVNMIGETYEESRADGMFYVWLNSSEYGDLTDCKPGGHESSSASRAGWRTARIPYCRGGAQKESKSGNRGQDPFCGTDASHGADGCCHVQ